MNEEDYIKLKNNPEISPLIDILKPTPSTVDELKKLNLPAGVDINIKILN